MSVKLINLAGALKQYINRCAPDQIAELSSQITRAGEQLAQINGARLVYELPTNLARDIQAKFQNTDGSSWVKTTLTETDKEGIAMLEFDSNQRQAEIARRFFVNEVKRGLMKGMLQAPEPKSGCETHPATIYLPVEDISKIPAKDRIRSDSWKVLEAEFKKENNKEQCTAFVRFFNGNYNRLLTMINSISTVSDTERRKDFQYELEYIDEHGQSHKLELGKNQDGATVELNVAIDGGDTVTGFTWLKSSNPEVKAFYAGANSLINAARRHIERYDKQLTKV